MDHPLVLLAAAVASLVSVVGLAVALRFLYQAWSDLHIGRDRRTGGDRRRKNSKVPMERRRRRDRRL